MGVATVAWVSSAKHEKSCDGMGKATASHKMVGLLAGCHFGLRAKECRYSEVVS